MDIHQCQLGNNYCQFIILMSIIYLYSTLLLIVVHADNILQVSDDDKELWDSAKRELAQRTREYIKENPISEELQSFIDEVRSSRRRKRQDHNNMYAVKDGELVPLAKLEEEFNSESNLGENFTVVPLIIPVPMEHSVTPKEGTPAAESDDLTDRGKSGKAILGRFTSKKSRESENCENEEAVVGNIVEDKLKSTSDSSDLGKVLEDVENLISAHKRGKGSKEGALCTVFGDWDSEAGGMTFYIKKNTDVLKVTMKPTEPPSNDGFITQSKWNVTGQLPFSQSAQIIITLTAHVGRRVALFLGECRICDGSETITGDWLIGRTSSNCKDQKASHSFVADVFRKNNVEALREAHMKKITSSTEEA